LMTGDMGRFDATGHLQLFGRKKNMIDTEEGKNVYAEDVEQVFEGLPVKEYCVFAANDIWPSRAMVGEQLVLVIHLEPGKRIVQMICGMHEFMQTWGYRVDNPYYDRTKRDGLFNIDQIPAGHYKVIAWHPHFKSVEKEISIASGEKVSLNFEFDSSEIRHSNYEIQENSG